MLPRARNGDDLLVHPLDDEIVVYDAERHDAHKLNRTAALVWRSCDGSRTVGDLTSLIRDEINSDADETAVLHALDVLREARLLADDTVSDEPDAENRRAFLRKLAVYGTPAAVAVVWSISSPTIAYAQSCVAPPDP